MYVSDIIVLQQVVHRIESCNDSLLFIIQMPSLDNPLLPLQILTYNPLLTNNPLLTLQPSLANPLSTLRILNNPLLSNQTCFLSITTIKNEKYIPIPHA